MSVVFVSHSSADIALVSRLVDLIQMGCDLSIAQVFCTSVDDADVGAGEDFRARIRQDMLNADLVLLVLSPNYFASRFCLAEMGAAWALEKDVFPLVLPDAERDPGVVFGGRHSQELTSKGLDALRDRIGNHHPAAKENTRRWNLKKADLLEDLAGLLGAAPEPRIVSAEQFDEQVALVKEARLMAKECEGDLQRSQRIIEDLSTKKDRSEVAAVLAQHEPALDVYQGAVESAQEEIGQLPHVILPALYFCELNGVWRPADVTWQEWRTEINEAEQNRWIVEVDENEFSLNEEHPSHQRALESVERLRTAIAGLAEDVKHDLERERGYLVDITVREYWERELVKGRLLS